MPRSSSVGAEPPPGRALGGSPGSPPSFVEYQRAHAQRLGVAMAVGVLCVVPAFHLADVWIHRLPPELWWRNWIVRSPVLALAVLWLLLHWMRPSGRWPRPLLVLLGLSIVGTGAGITWGYALGGGALAEISQQRLMLSVIVASLAATGGVRDLLWIYGAPVAVVALITAAVGPERGVTWGHMPYTAMAMAIGAVIAGVLHRGHLRTFAAIQTLSTNAMTDPLTGLLNRRAMNDHLEAVHARARRHSSSYALVLLDLDRFKELNDTYGHEVGDQVLEGLGRRLAQAVRVEDRVARWGGEEFLLLLQDGDDAAGLSIGEKLRARVAERPFPTSVGDLVVTVSVGVTAADVAETPAQVVKRADLAMYRAKRDGRNRTVLEPVGRDEAAGAAEGRGEDASSR